MDYKDKDGKKTSEFHSHFFDNDWKQAAYTTHQNNLVLLGHLQKKGFIKIGRTIWLSNTDGCAAQYRCGNAMYLVSILASQFQIIINRAIVPPGHGKDVVNGLSGITKWKLCNGMHTVKIEGADVEENVMSTCHIDQDGNKISYAALCQKYCQSKDFTEGCKTIKNGKREKKSVVDRIFFIHCIELSLSLRILLTR